MVIFYSIDDVNFLMYKIFLTILIYEMGLQGPILGMAHLIT